MINDAQNRMILSVARGGEIQICDYRLPSFLLSLLTQTMEKRGHRYQGAS